ncbi:glycosyl hydrolase family 18 protein [Luteimonas vadosa]|uniref:chitinase n=1 Tax=Luteimonas vadosa TaxID=1165507 RepID=A0ABP9DSB6_9GAMM
MRFRRRSTALVAALLLACLFLAYAAGRNGNTGNIAPGVTLTSPSAPTTLQAGTVLSLAADAHDSDGTIAHVQFYVDGVRVARDTSAPYQAQWSGEAGSHEVWAVATDNRKATTRSTTVAVTVVAAAPDKVPPSVPTGLSIAGQTSASISLQWEASVDNAGGSGVAGYDLFRDGALVGSTSATRYTDSALAPGTSYSYAVRSRDVAGNASQGGPTLVASTMPASSTASRRVVGYFTQWGIYNQNYKVRDLEASGTASRLTHLAYAFGNVRNNRCEVGVLKATDERTGEGGDAYADYSRTFTAAESVDGVGDVWGAPLRGNWNQLRKLKARHPGLKVMISLGGWTWSRGFASAARPENRQAFVASCIDAYIHGNLPAFDYAGGPGAAAGVFDGFDIDWEYPAACGLACGSAEDTANFTALLAEFRRQLDAVRPGLVLSVAAGGGIDKIRVTRPDLYHPSVDFINVMTYDFHGSWESSTNFHSALFNADGDPSQGDARLYNSHDAIQAFLDRGVPSQKLLLGMASYGRGWTNVSSQNNGLFQAGIPAAGSLQPGIESYRVLSARGYPMYSSPSARARWAFDGKTFWSYDDPTTIADKMAYVRAQGLGGAFLWDFSGDDAQGSLVSAIGAGLAVP